MVSVSWLFQGKERLADQKRQEMAGDTRSDHLMLISAYEVSASSRVSCKLHRHLCVGLLYECQGCKLHRHLCVGSKLHRHLRVFCSTASRVSHLSIASIN